MARGSGRDRGRFRKSERSLTAVATAPDQHKACLPRSEDLTTAVHPVQDVTAQPPPAAETHRSMHASAHVRRPTGGRRWIRTTGPSLVRRHGRNAVATSENPGQPELKTLKARGH